MDKIISSIKYDATLQENNVCYFKVTPYATFQFPKHSECFELISLQKYDCILSISIKKSKNLKKHLRPQLVRLKDIQSDKTVLNDYIIYGNISNNVDVCFTTTGRVIDEIIEIKSEAKKYKVCYLLNFSNMHWEYCKSENKILFFNSNDNTEVFCIPFSFMTDADGILSIGVKYKIKPISDTCIQVQIEANKSWIEEHKDNMPIKIHRQLIIRT